MKYALFIILILLLLSISCSKSMDVGSFSGDLEESAIHRGEYRIGMLPGIDFAPCHA